MVSEMQRGQHYETLMNLEWHSVRYQKLVNFGNKIEGPDINTSDDTTFGIVEPDAGGKSKETTNNSDPKENEKVFLYDNYLHLGDDDIKSFRSKFFTKISSYVCQKLYIK